VNHAEITQLLGAYALDAVEDDERAEVRSHLAGCARCRAEVQEHLEVASLLAHEGADAPTGLWGRIAGSLEEAPPGLRLVPAAAGRPAASSSPPARRRPGTWLAAGAVAAAVALVVGVLGLEVVRQDDRIAELETALDDPLQAAYGAALADPRSTVLELTSADGAVRLRGAVAPDGTGYLRADDLPHLEADRTYQLWGGAGDRLVSLGVLGEDPRVVSFEAEPYELFAITEEAEPGVVTSANPPVVAGASIRT
jgi:hypothetical protein